MNFSSLIPQMKPEGFQSVLEKFKQPLSVVFKAFILVLHLNISLLLFFHPEV